MKRALPPGWKHRKEQISSADQKAAVTLISFITPDSSIQPKLPQVILGNKHRLTLELLASLAPPSHFRLWREESSWVNRKVMCRLLTLLVQSLAAYKDTHTITLVLDVASCHRHIIIYQYATRLGVRLVFVPAKLIFLLQPLDVSGFHRLKSKLRRRWRELAIDSETGTISHHAWLSAVFQVATQVFNGVSWKVTFRAVGLLDEQCLSARVLEYVGWTSLPQVPGVLPSEAQLKCLFPKRGKNSRNSLFSWALPKAMAKGKAKAKAKALSAAHAYAPNLD
jgi:hypothetical protein